MDNGVPEAFDNNKQVNGRKRIQFSMTSIAVTQSAGIYGHCLINSIERSDVVGTTKGSFVLMTEAEQTPGGVFTLTLQFRDPSVCALSTRKLALLT